MRKLIYILAIIFIFAITFSNNAMSGSMPKTIKIGYLDYPSGHLLNKALGLASEEMDMPVEWIKFGSGRDVNVAMASGSLHFGGVGNPPLSIGLSSNIKYQVIYAIELLTSLQTLVAKPEIKSVKDLQDKVIGVPYASTTHFLLMNLLKDEGVKAEVLDMNPSDMLAAFQRGDIDAGYIWEPVLSNMIRLGGVNLLNEKQQEDRDKKYPTWDVIVVNKEFAREFPCLVVKYLNSEVRAAKYWHTDFNKSAKAISEEINVDLDTVKKMMNGVNTPTLEEQLSPDILGTHKNKGAFVDAVFSTAKFMNELGRIPKVASKEQIAEGFRPEFLEAVRLLYHIK